MGSELITIGRHGHEVALKTFDLLSSEDQQKTAEIISHATTQPDINGELPQMLPMNPCDLYKKFMGLVASVDGEFAGFIGASTPISHEGQAMSEVGSLWVESGLRQHGIGGLLVNAASHLLQLENIRAYAFCNPHSIGLFARNQYTPATLLDVPQEAGSLCAQCPMLGARKLGVECCDTVMVYNNREEVGQWTR